MGSNWFTTEKVADNIYLTREMQFFEGNRSNIWLIKGPQRDVIIDCGLGVCNLRHHLESCGLLSPTGDHQRPCDVICTHVHFDHSGGAHHFENVFIHELDLPGLQNGRQTETLNYVKTAHFDVAPYSGFSACSYKVPPTLCQPLIDRDRIDLGDGQQLEILHVPGHTKGSIAIYYEEKQILFSGDFVYECGNGSNFLDWLPTSCVRDYVTSAETVCDWLSDHDVSKIYPGHFGALSGKRTHRLLQQYIDAKDSCCNRGCTSCFQAVTWGYFLMGLFRCCPC